MTVVHKTLNNIQTSLLTEDNPFNCDGKDVIICVTGNPGVIDFYKEFSEELYRNTNLPVCVVGHAGHEKLPDSQSYLIKHEHLFNLKGQLKHKEDLLENHINSKSRLHFIGHSIGAWLIIELLNRNDHLFEKTSSVSLLFPTIQRMAESENGLWLNNFVRKVHSFVLILIKLLYLMPEKILYYVIEVYLRLKKLPSLYNSRIMKFLDPIIFEKILMLSYDEMDCVTLLNSKGIEKIKHFTNIIYTPKDGWAPLRFMKDLTKYQPDLHIKEVNTDHAFVLKSSKNIALMVSDFINSKISNNLKQKTNPQI